MTANEKKEIKPYYGANALRRIEEGYSQIDEEKNDLLLKFMRFEFSNPKAKEYTHHGFLRRVGILHRCIHNVFSITPPEHVEKITHEQSNNLAINLQSFVMNVFGCLDNIAWIWVYHRGLTIDKMKVGLKPKHKELRNTLPLEFQKTLESFGQWFEYIEGYRDSLAHRIPLYVPPMSLTHEQGETYNQLDKKMWDALKIKDLDNYERMKEEQESLGRFYPWMQHSFSEAQQPMAYHGQILIDWITIIKLGNDFHAELLKL